MWGWVAKIGAAILLDSVFNNNSRKKYSYKSKKNVPEYADTEICFDARKKNFSFSYLWGFVPFLHKNSMGMTRLFPLDAKYTAQYRILRFTSSKKKYYYVSMHSLVTHEGEERKLLTSNRDFHFSMMALQNDLSCFTFTNLQEYPFWYKSSFTGYCSTVCNIDSCKNNRNVFYSARSSYLENYAFFSTLKYIFIEITIDDTFCSTFLNNLNAFNSSSREIVFIIDVKKNSVTYIRSKMHYFCLSLTYYLRIRSFFSFHNLSQESDIYDIFRIFSPSFRKVLFYSQLKYLCGENKPLPNFPQYDVLYVLPDLSLVGDSIFKYNKSGIYDVSFCDFNFYHDIGPIKGTMKNVFGYKFNTIYMMCDLYFRFIDDDILNTRLDEEWKDIPIHYIRYIKNVMVMFLYHNKISILSSCINYPQDYLDYSYHLEFPITTIIHDLFRIIGFKGNIIFPKYPRQTILGSFLDFHEDPKKLLIKFLKVINHYFYENADGDVFISQYTSKYVSFSKNNYISICFVRDKIKDTYFNKPLKLVTYDYLGKSIGNDTGHSSRDNYYGKKSHVIKFNVICDENQRRSIYNKFRMSFRRFKAHIEVVVLNDFNISINSLTLINLCGTDSFYIVKNIDYYEKTKCLHLYSI